MKRILPLFTVCFLLLFYRFATLSLRASDTNVYFYTAHALLKGQLLYRDIFFTNLPLFPYVSALYLLISGSNIFFYYLTPTIEISINALLIYYLVYKKTTDSITAWLSSLLYLFSFIILSTSDHQTGVFLASFFALVAYYFTEKKQFVMAGVFLACCLFTKAYFLPVFLAFFLTLLFKKQYKAFLHQSIGFIITGAVILLPFFLFARQEIFNDVIAYSLTRSAGVEKLDIFWFFVMKDCIFFLLLLFNLYNFRKNSFFALVSFFACLFFFFYKDVYYLYLNFFIPFLCLSLPSALTLLQKTFHPQKFVLPSFLIVFLLYTSFTYFSGYSNLGNVDTNQLAHTIRSHHPAALYGTNDITPLLAFLSHTPMLDGIIDTNTNIFRKGILDAKILSQRAVKSHALIISHGASYPSYGINEPLMDEIFDKKLILSHCKLIASQPVFAEGVGNRINLFSCQ